MFNDHRDEKIRPIHRGIFVILTLLIAGVTVYTVLSQLLTNTPPQAVADEYVTNVNSVLTVAGVAAGGQAGVLHNDIDLDEDQLSALLVSGTSRGLLHLDGITGGFTYAPDSGFVGTDRFIYKAFDGRASSDDTVVYIQVVGTVPTADFEVLIEEGDNPLRVTFADRSSGTPTWWQWDFGDGETSREQHPIHVYTSSSYEYIAADLEAGDGGCFALTSPYTVRLTAQNVFGSNSYAQDSLIVVAPRTLTLSLQAEPYVLTESAVQVTPRSSSICGDRASSENSTPAGSYFEMQEVRIQARHEVTHDGQTWQFDRRTAPGVDAQALDARLPNGDHAFTLKLTQSATVIAHYVQVR